MQSSMFYSPFHSSLPFEHLGQSNLFTRVCRLPFEHLGQSNLFTRVCRLFVNQVTFYSILELKQCPRCNVFLKSIQHLSLVETKQNFINLSSYLMAKIPHCKLKISFEFAVLEVF